MLLGIQFLPLMFLFQNDFGSLIFVIKTRCTFYEVGIVFFKYYLESSQNSRTIWPLGWMQDGAPKRVEPASHRKTSSAFIIMHQGQGNVTNLIL